MGLHGHAPLFAPVRKCISKKLFKDGERVLSGYPSPSDGLFIGLSSCLYVIAYAGITLIHHFLPVEFHIAVNYAPRENVDTGCDECVVRVLRFFGIDDFFRIIHRRAET